MHQRSEPEHRAEGRSADTPGGVVRIKQPREEGQDLPPRLESRLFKLAKHVGPLDEFLVALTEEVVGALGIPVAEVLRSTPRGFVPCARFGLPVGSEVAPLGQDSYAGYTARAGETLAAANYLLENRFKTVFLRDNGIRSGVATPIRDGSGAPWGVLAAHDLQSRSFGTDDLLYIEEAAKLAEVFVERDLAERARLRPLEDAARQERAARTNAEFRLGYYSKACRLAAVSATTPLALKTVAGHAVPTIADWCFVDLVPLDDRDTVLRVAVEHADDRSMADEWAEVMRRSYPLDYRMAHGTPTLIATGEPILLNKIDDATFVAASSARDEGLLKAIRGLGVRSYMGVPIEAEHGRVGAVGFYQTTSGRTFTPEDLEFAKVLAPIMGARLAAAGRTLDALQVAEEENLPRHVPIPSPAEQRVLDHLAAGLIPREIAQRLHRSERTVRNQVQSLNHQFGARDYNDTVRRALKMGVARPVDRTPGNPAQR